MGTNETVGFVGIGNQGAPIAMRIHDGGIPLAVWARRPEAMDEFRSRGARCVTTLAELGRTSTMVAVCVTTDDDVRTVTLGPDGLLAAMGPGTTLAVHSTVHPDTVAAVQEAAAAVGVSVLDAPVSGGHAGAEAGTMAVLLGGDHAVIERWRPVFATFATTVEVLGGIGAGQRAKLVNNALSSVTLAASLDALQAAEELGLDREAAYRVMTASSGDSFMLRRAPMVDDQGAGLAAARLRKDLVLLQELVRPGDRRAGTLADAADRAVTGLEERAASR